MAFSRVSTGDSDIPSSCEMKQEPEFKPMQGNWASSRVDFGYTEIFHIPVVTSVFFKTCEGFLGDSLYFVKQIKASYLFNWEQGITLHAMRGIRPHLSAIGKSDDFSRVAAGSWGMFSSYGGGKH